MSKNIYYHNQHDQKSIHKMEIHPVWRGIGFILMILTPILGYFGSDVIVNLNTNNNWVYIPRELLLRGDIDPYLILKIVITIFLMIIIYGIYMLVTFSIYSLFGPSRYGSYDVPITSFRGKKSDR